MPLVLALVSLAQANPHPLPFTYPYATLPKQSLEVEQYVDLTPVPAFDTSGASVAFPRSALTTEVEYGLTDHLELGLYYQLSDDPGSSTGQVPLQFDGIKQRLRLRLAEPGQWPVDVSLYLELAELSREVEVEGKVNLEKRFGPVQLLVNLWGERELYYDGNAEWIANPTGGIAVEITPAVSLGVEAWAHGEFGGLAGTSGAFNPAFHAYVGPTAMLQGGKLWWSVAPYARLDQWDRTPQFGDQYGHVWVRTAIGIEL